MLKICLVFWESEPQYAYKLYAYIKKHVLYLVRECQFVSIKSYIPFPVDFGAWFLKDDHFCFLTIQRNFVCKKPIVKQFQINIELFLHLFRRIVNITLFPRIMVHALKYETEAIVHAPKESPIQQIFGGEKNRSVSYLSACHCRESGFDVQCRVFAKGSNVLNLYVAFSIHGFYYVKQLLSSLNRQCINIISK